MQKNEKKCSNCGKKCSSKMCRMCYLKSKRLPKRVTTSCSMCGIDVSVNRSYLESIRKNGENGPYCDNCRSKVHSKTLRLIRSKQTPKRRSEIAKKARMCVRLSGSELVRRQWDSIKSDPKSYARKKKKLRQQSIDFWNGDDEETKNRVIKTLSESNNCGRSKGSEELKKRMVECGLYEGFESEQVFHGFIPDEINHDLRLIVEYYGDVYHCNPRKYKDKTKFLKHIGRTVEEQWKRDRIRLAVFYKHGYTVVIVWESDFRKNPEKETERIRHAIDKQKEAE